MDRIDDYVELARLQTLGEQLDMMWKYTQHDMVLRHEHRIMRARCLEKADAIKRRLGYKCVYRIVNGSAAECLFEGSAEACLEFVRQHRDCEPADDVMICEL